MSTMLKADKQWLIGTVTPIQAAMPPQNSARMATTTRPIGQLPPRQVNGSRRQLQLENHLEINILRAHSTAQSLKCHLLVAPMDRD